MGRNKQHKLNRIFRAALLLVIFFNGQTVLAQTVDPQRLLEQVDDNMWSDTKYIEGRLVIDNGRRVRTLEWENWMQGVDRSYSHYKSPPREKGTKMLKIGKKLWMYTPRTDRKILIAGHLLRQSMMGSDLSYEDMTEDRKLSSAYQADLQPCDEKEIPNCVILFLTAHDRTTTYYTRKLWVDSGKKVVLVQELNAKSGKLIKKIWFMDYRRIDHRLFPKKMIFRDMLKENTKTTYLFDKIEFDISIPPKYFSLSILKR